MKNTSGTAVWMLGALFISVLVGAGAYFLLISPELDKASTATAELQTAQEFNNVLDTQILAAKTAAKKVDAWHAEIAAIRLDLPPTPEQAAFERLVNDGLRKEGLPTVSITYGGPVNVAPPASDVGASSGVKTTGSAATDAGANSSVGASASPTAAPSAAPVAPGGATAQAAGSAQVQVKGLVQTPVTITTEGEPAPILRFLLDMQTQNSRFFTVTKFDISRSSGAEAKAARPALKEGDWVINITGLVFNLFDPELSLPVKEPAATPPFTGNPGRNAFLPIPGTGVTATK